MADWMTKKLETVALAALALVALAYFFSAPTSANGNGAQVANEIGLFEQL